MVHKDYYIGLDMGTNSVGWAVTDPQYNLIRVKGKDFWGIREFDEAKTSVDRRTKRISRRRRQRELVRVGLLKSYFASEIEKVDSNFFIRLDNSKYYVEDKDEAVKGKNGIFADENYQDKDYYHQYPTIFHLRKALLEDSVTADEKYSRLVYLAILNMFKHRGHFLNASLSDRDEIVTIKQLYPAFLEQADNVLGMTFADDVAEEIENILGDRGLSRSVRAEKINAVLGLDKKQKKEQIVVKCLCGLKVDAAKIFDDLETEEKIEISFSDFGYEEKVDTIAAVLGDERFELVDVMKQIYDAGMLSGILRGSSYLSVARVAEYDKHHSDLVLLKALFRDHLSEADYDAMFREDTAGSYSAYVGSTNSAETGILRRTADGRKREDFYKNVKKYLKGIKDDDRVEYINKEMEKETFMPKQLTPGNGIIPNQVHKMELAAILRNAEKYLPFLSEKDSSGLTVTERIVKLFAYQIPYYIGPTSEKSARDKGNGWVIRKAAGQVLPWNFDEKIDVEKTQEEFIKRLIRDCSYINGEKVLPKASLAYEAYCVLNEINNIRIDGERIEPELKQAIYNDLFTAGKKVTRKKLCQYLISSGAMQEADQLSGIDIAINNSLSSYGKFYAVFGDAMKTDSCKRMVERIIELATIYGDSKKTLKNAIMKEFGTDLTEAQVKRILGYKFKDWGRLSRGFLELQGVDTSTGEIMSLIRAMWETNMNMMELINSEAYGFKEALEEKKFKATQTLADFKAEDLDEFYFSAPVKRMVWQTILLIKEIQKIMGCAPKRVFIEMTRSDEEKGDKGRKDSRSKQLIALYKDIKGQTRNWEKEIQTADENGTLRSKKLYLYYMQMGRCMYTNEPIDLEELFTTKYDIDHIYPRHYVKDDNISNNLVLVNKSSNAYKSDNYPLEPMKPEVYALWKLLHEHKLINDEKYKRLTGRNPFTDEQKAGFIARQLVETSQGTKGVADLLKQLLPEPETKVVYAKGRNVSEFRSKNNLLKTRTLNDFHHAKDAYLNIVVGNVYFTKFTQNPLNFIRKELAMDEKKYHYNLDKMYQWNVVRGGETAWIAGKDGTIATVKKVMGKNTPLLTRLTFEARGAIANETLYSKRKAKADNYIPLKSDDPKMQDVTRYGGFTSVSGAYFMLVEHEEKGKKIRTLEPVPIYLKAKLEVSEDALLQYCIDELKMKNPRICLKKIRMQTLFEINGFRLRLSGRTGNQLAMRNEVQMCLGQEWNNYIHYIDRFIEKGLVDEALSINKNIELYDLFVEKHVNGIFSKRPNPIGSKLQSGREKFVELSNERQCFVISQILGTSVIGPTLANLSDIGAASQSGKMLISKNIAKNNEIYMVNQSITGIYEHKINLLAL